MASYESKKITVSINTAIIVGKKTWDGFAMTPNALFQFFSQVGSARWYQVQTFESNTNLSHKSKITSTQVSKFFAMSVMRIAAKIN